MNWGRWTFAFRPITGGALRTFGEDGRRRYEARREQLIAVYSSTSCELNGCTFAYESNLCIQTCGIPMTSGWAQVYEENLKGFAESECSSCPPIPLPPCSPPNPTICTAMGCQEHLFP